MLVQKGHLWPFVAIFDHLDTFLQQKIPFFWLLHLYHVPVRPEHLKINMIIIRIQATESNGRSVLNLQLCSDLL